MHKKLIALFAASALIASSLPGQFTSRLLKDIVPGTGGSAPCLFVEVPITTVFATSRQIWTTGGDPVGTALLKTIPTVTNVAPPGFVAQVGDKAYFFCDSVDGKGPCQIWEADGKRFTTRLLAHMTALGWARSPVVAGNKIFFEGRGPRSGIADVWAIDPTGPNPSPVRLRQFQPTNRLDVSIVAIGGEVLFSVEDAVVGSELWRSDGTVAGTRLVKDVWPGSKSGFSHMIGAFGDRVFFVGNDGQSGWELWETDGTAQGTKLFKDFNPNGDGFPTLLGQSGELVYCETPAGSGYDMWAVHRKTKATTKLWTGTGRPGSAVPFHGGLLFLAGLQPYFTDGTTKGTVQLTSAKLIFRSGQGFWPFDDRIAFFPDPIGRLYITDGTPAGTKILNTGNVQLSNPFASHGKLFFRGIDSTYGAEPRVVDILRAHTTRLGTGLGVNARIPSLSASDPLFGTNMTVQLDGCAQGSVAILFVAPGRNFAISFPPNAYFYLNYNWLLPVAHVPSGLIWKQPIPIPNALYLRALPIGLQAMLLGTGAARGYEISNAVFAYIDN